MKTGNKILIHVLFWVISFVIFSFSFNLSGGVSRIDLIFSVLFHISLFYGAYVNLALVSVFFRKKKYVQFALGIMCALASAVLLNQLAFDYLADLLFPGYYLISNFAWWEVALVIAIYMLITTLLKLSYAWFELERARRKLALIDKENIQSELRMLKAQMNPHFLFNSLNAIYALAMKESDKTPDAIIQLADILRYVIYQSNQDRVALKDEVKLISDYIELQKLRIDSSSTITFVHQLQNEYAEIASLLLLPLVENSFKHGVKADLFNTFVDINLQATDAEVVFQISNSNTAAASSENTAGTDMEDNHNGVGNDNIRQRLNLLYPDRHSFDVRETEESYRVKLILIL